MLCNHPKKKKKNSSKKLLKSPKLPRGGEKKEKIQNNISHALIINSELFIIN